MLFLLLWRSSKIDRCLLKTKVGWDCQLPHGWANSHLLRRVGKRKREELLFQGKAQSEGETAGTGEWACCSGCSQTMGVYEKFPLLGRPGLLLHSLSSFCLLERLMPWHLWSSCCRSNAPGLWQNWSRQVGPWSLWYPSQPTVSSCLLCLY